MITLDLGDTGISLGQTVPGLQAFREFARFGEYPELFGVPHAEDTVSREYLGKVKEQAVQLIALHGSKLSGHAQWILRQLITEGKQND